MLYLFVLWIHMENVYKMQSCGYSSFIFAFFSLSLSFSCLICFALVVVFVGRLYFGCTKSKSFWIFVFRPALKMSIRTSGHAIQHSEYSIYIDRWLERVVCITSHLIHIIIYIIRYSSLIFFRSFWWKYKITVKRFYSGASI